ncbi:hypothetical protein CKM354_000393900 [Cercospora kikuchii]|uniref:Serum paraoxonase/arylesterase n=1 Tax=Cercospora kikuchii TaxID=84275 RepID=A0A9P3FE63_9PEZI|nr:uncharacterized protein CKM354_000393900 [Cercospora kikuchii]GIZ40607.1 hypothetical protein CKM354_000393900 [Cercospora kikuchii]
MSQISKYGPIVALIGALSYQFFLKDVIWVLFGVGRHVQPISDFPGYQCRRIHDPRLQACEDMWLSEETRQLFLACSDSLSRKEWMPNIGRFNATGRALNDAIIVMDIDKPDGKSFQYRVLDTPGFPGVNGDGRLHLVGFTGRETPDSIELLLVNAQPAIDATTKQLQDIPDMTIEAFQTDKKQTSTSLKHIHTYRHSAITTPNNIAFSQHSSGFYFTNDHGDAISGFRHSIAPFTGNGNIAYCELSTGSSDSTCKIVSSGSFNFPNGLATSKTSPNTLFVPSAWTEGGIHVFKANGPNPLEKDTFISIPYPLDNLSQDKNGDIWAAGIPKGLETLGAFEDPLNSVASTTVFKIWKEAGSNTAAVNGGYQTLKALEDRDKEVLPGATTVIHDATTGRLFLSGVTSPFITVCDKVL